MGTPHISAFAGPGTVGNRRGPVSRRGLLFVLPHFVDVVFQLGISSTIMGRTLKEPVIIFDTTHFQPVRTEA
jgi:hypothetical protein